MTSLETTFNQHAFLFWLVLAALFVGLTIWIFRVHRVARDAESRYYDLFDSVNGDNAARMLVEYLGTVRSTAESVARIKREHDEVVRVMPEVVRHVGLVRFSPFHDTGGDQSFALAVLDGRGDGVVLTGLHSRHDSRLYAKPIERGRSRYSLTPEEVEAMNQALVSGETPVPS